MRPTKDIEDYQDIMVFVEIQDHEQVLEGSLELLSKARHLADKLEHKLFAVVFGKDVEQYLPEIEVFCPDAIIYCSHENLKHYDSQIVPDMFTQLIKKYKPFAFLSTFTEAGKDLTPRLAQRFSTGCTSHCTDLDIEYLPEYDKQLLMMKRPAFSGNVIVTIVSPDAMPQMATVQPGVFSKEEYNKLADKLMNKPEIIQIEFDYDMGELRINNLDPPTRWNKKHVLLENASLIVAGGRGVKDKKTFELLYELAELLNGEVGATRVPVFKEWCSEERMIGQTGKTIRPKLYIGLGVSGQIQHTSSIVESEIIVSVNTDEKALINEMSDYVLIEDAVSFIKQLIIKLKQEIRQQ
ncbi:MAG: electron transfer flavoprotein subunit alpha/FixB family protein [Desulfobacteraceae bacterium]|nr:electron transfer flavoprotein subunit alpha/FixB family protein [Desulfobacteraceae bacterium]